MQLTEHNKFILSTVHYLRLKNHWGKKWADENAFKNGRWPSNAKDWRQTGHGASWDTNVEMAQFHLQMHKDITNAVSNSYR